MESLGSQPLFQVQSGERFLQLQDGKFEDFLLSAGESRF